jgi:hypothetical protein
MPHERKTARRTDAEWPSSVRTQLGDAQVGINSRPPIIAARARERARCLLLLGMQKGQWARAHVFARKCEQSTARVH